MFRRDGQSFGIWLILFFLASPAFAQLPGARLYEIFPPGGRAGTKFDVTIRGVSLEGATELVFSRPGIKATLTDTAQNGAERKFTITIDPDVPVGECEVRFRSVAYDKGARVG